MSAKFTVNLFLATVFACAALVLLEGRHIEPRKSGYLLALAFSACFANALLFQLDKIKNRRQ